MDDFVNVLAEVFEFVVGGMLVLAATVFVILGVTPGQTWSDDVLEYLRGTDQALLAGIVGIVLSYAVGILGEGGSHALFEWRLDRATWAHEAFRTERGLDELPPAEPWHVALRHPRWPSRVDRAELKVLKKERERQRTYVMSRHPLIHRQVESQLKRLRVERMAALASLLFVVGFGLRHEWASAGIAAVLSVYLVWLVFRRFGRFCSSISAGYAHGRDEEAMPAAQ